MSNPTNARPVQLHVLHDLGGGSSKWVADYSAADTDRVNLVLRSFTHDASAGTGVALYRSAADEDPLQVWQLARPIGGAAASHAEYRAILEDIIAGHEVRALLVSSLIGHSLDVLDTGLPTLVVTHDYFPYSPTINLYFGVSGRDPARIGEDLRRDRSHVDPFVEFTPEERDRVRERYMELVRRPNVTMVVPSESVRDNLLRLDERFARVRYARIPHGYPEPLARVAEPGDAPGGRLRVLVLGQLSRAKGVDLLRDALPQLRSFADIYLVGCKELGETFKFEPQVQVVSYYEPDQLPIHLAHIRPHVGLLMSIVPETFSYTLSELCMMGIPPAATRLGSFPERIRHLETGYLYEPDAASLVATLKAIDADRATLARIRANLRDWKERSAAEMVADYHRALPIEGPAPPASRPPESRAQPAAPDAITIASMWKQVRGLNLQLGVVDEARHRAEQQRRDQEQRFERARRGLEERLERYGREISERNAQLLQRHMQLAEKDRHIQALTQETQAQAAKIAEIYSSTSWKVSGPVRAIGFLLPKVRIVARVGLIWLRDPSSRSRISEGIRTAWRAGGWHEVKKALVQLQAPPPRSSHDAWLEYREKLVTDLHPQIAPRVARMPRHPMISVIVPVYNPVEDMMRQMLDSVRAQIYPYWELCIVDDASTEPYVRAVLQEYAAADPRIRLDFVAGNGGVSHASNRALAMAKGDHVVLLDHDDMLEEQALFRVAECILEDDPDIAYSDEVLVEHDGKRLLRFTHRPAFSREYLRSHPYIVHLAAFRTGLLRSLEGFDESLRISQDYDLMLRATEKARTIVHIPEVLYRWRIHGSSAGVARMHEVMDVSKDALRRHLERCGDVGTVDDGHIFNFFDVRYPLREGLRVGIVIPTKNHGELLRQCIESIRRTVSGVAYDIVVVDHESDDPATRDYLASIAAEVRVLRYEGPFNFSAINNFAVARIAGPYSHYLFCNNDIEAIEPGWLERLVELGQQPDIGIVGAKLFYPDRTTIQHAGVCVGLFGAAEHYAKRVRFPDQPVEPGFNELLRANHEVSAVTAACLLIRRDTFEEVGGFDEAIAVGFGDVDLCLNAGKLGYRVVFCPHARLVHHESLTRGVSAVDPHPADSALFQLKWKQLLRDGDPYYSPSLSLTSTTWAMRQPLPCTLELRRRVVRADPSSGRRYWLP